MTDEGKKVAVELDREFLSMIATQYKDHIDSPEKMEKLPMALVANLVFIAELMSTVGYEKTTMESIASHIMSVAFDAKEREKELAADLTPDLGLD